MATIDGVTLTLEAVGVPATLPRINRADEIRALPSYLQVNMATPAGLSLVNVGDAEPAAANRGLPWFKTGSTGTPIGIYYWTGAAWASLMPTATQVVQHGEFNLNVISGEALSSGDVTFSQAYASAPAVMVMPKYNSSYPNLYLRTYFAVPTTTKLTLYANQTAYTSTVLTTFYWMAFGVLA